MRIVRLEVVLIFLERIERGERVAFVLVLLHFLDLLRETTCYCERLSRSGKTHFAFVELLVVGVVVIDSAQLIALLFDRFVNLVTLTIPRLHCLKGVKQTAQSSQVIPFLPKPVNVSWSEESPFELECPFCLSFFVSDSFDFFRVAMSLVLSSHFLTNVGSELQILFLPSSSSFSLSIIRFSFLICAWMRVKENE